MAESDPRIDAILFAIGELTRVVGALVERDAQVAISPSAPTVTSLTQDAGYAPLVQTGSDEEVTRRYKLVRMVGLSIGTDAANALMDGGARGYYRGLARDEGQHRLALPRATALALIEDAMLEDQREAVDMSHDLLKVWEASPPPTPGVDPPTVSL